MVALLIWVEWDINIKSNLHKPLPIVAGAFFSRAVHYIRFDRVNNFSLICAVKMNILFIGLGGFIGTILRYLSQVLFLRLMPASVLPYGTMFVNIVGCLIIGIVIGLSEKYLWLTPGWRVFLATGFCGGFTTFSAFAFENVQMLQQSNYTGFALYSILTFIICLAAVFLGLYISK